MPSMSPSLVCLQCFIDNSKATWLSYLTCIKPGEHSSGMTITAVVTANQLVPVRPASHLGHVDLSEIMECDYAPNCFRQGKCKFAHSSTELDYWRWQKAKDIFCSQLPLLVGYQAACIVPCWLLVLGNTGDGLKCK